MHTYIFVHSKIQSKREVLKSPLRGMASISDIVITTTIDKKNSVETTELLYLIGACHI